MIVNTITWLLFFALFYLLLTSVILFRNRLELIPLCTQKIKIKPKISVCIPARNEQASIENLLKSLEIQSCDHFEVHVLDDQSTDDTFMVADKYQQKSPGQFNVYRGEKKPENWLGKPWACYQLSEKCVGDIYLFLDADTVLQRDTLTQIAATLEKYDLDMLTVWPKQKTGTFWEKTIIPLVYFSLVTLLPAIYVYRNPRWMPPSFGKYFRPKFAAACGQCIAFKKKAYKAINGHRSVKNEIVEDVKLAQQIKKNGLTMRMFNGVGSISCRMYRSEKEIFNGFRKNFFAGFNHSFPVFLTAGVLHLIVFVLPFISVFLSIIDFNPTLFFLSAALISIILFQRLILALWFEFDSIYSLTHPFGVLWFQQLALVKIWDQFTGTSQTWKGRKI